MENELQNRVLMITGAGKAPGRALALAFASHGARVAAVDLMPQNVSETVEAVRSSGGRARTFLADVAKKMQIQAAVEEIRDAFERIDILINADHVAPTASLLEMDEWDWDRTQAVNLKGSFLTTQSVGRVMAEEGGGVILNLLSLTVGCFEGRAALMASQTALLGLTAAAASELAAYNIRVNAIATEVHADADHPPSPRKTRWGGWSDLTRPQDLGAPEDPVELALFLTSQDAAGIRGKVFLAPAWRERA